MPKGPRWMLCPQWGISLNYCGSAEKEAQQGQTGNLALVLGYSIGNRALVVPTLPPPPYCQAEWARGCLPRKTEQTEMDGFTWWNPLPSSPTDLRTQAAATETMSRFSILLTKLITVEEWLMHSRDPQRKTATYLWHWLFQMLINILMW